MEIKDERNQRHVTFGSIKWGECFIYEDTLYLKVHEVHNFNAIIPSSGVFVDFCDGISVLLVDAHIVIKDWE